MAEPTGVAADLMERVERCGQLSTLMGLLDSYEWADTYRERYLCLGKMLVFFDEFMRDEELLADVGQKMDENWKGMREDERDTIPSDLILQQHAAKEIKE